MGPDSASPSRFWATASLVAGGLWLLLSLAPLFVTTLLGLPFAAFALWAGWIGRRDGGRVNDPTAILRANWGLGLGCAGCVWQVVYFTLVGGALFVGLPSLIQYIAGTATP